ncbi:MAG: PAS domain-containing protein [Sphaerochaetaceae bacterium]
MDQEKLEDLIPKLKKLFDQAPCGVGLFDSHGFHVFLNQTFFKMTGYSETELKQSGNNLDLLICPEDRKSTMDTLSKFWDADKPIEVEYRIVQKNGIHSWVRLDISMISLNGMKFAFAFLTDITEGKTKSIELEMIAQNSADSISIFRIKGKQMALEYANPKFFELLDTTPQQYHENEKHLIDASVSEEDYIRTSEAVNEAINTGKSGELLYQFRKNDGTVLWLDRRFAAIKQEDDAYLLVSTVSDVTSLVNSKQELAHKQKLYQLVIDQLHAAVFQWDHANGTYYSSEGYSRYAMSRISPDLILANKGPDDIYNHDDEPELLRFFKASKDGSPSAEAAIRMKLIDGSFRWCKLIGLFSYDQNGRSLRTVGIIIDINEEREKSFMLSQLIDEIPGGIAIFKVGQLLECPYFNEGFGKLTGWKGE